MELYPDNTLAHYVTKLPQRIELDGQWEVGLVEIQYPHSWYNIPEDCDRQMTIMHTLDSGLIETNIFHIPPGYYKPETLLERIKSLATYAATIQTSAAGQDIIKLEYDEVDQTYVCDLRGYMLDVGPHVASLLGLDNTYFPRGPHRGRTAINADPIYSLYIYSDLVEPRVVGDVMAPLVRIVPVLGKHGENIMKSYENVHYIPLQRRSFETVEIDIKDRTGKTVPFERGTLNVTLHFRRRRRVL